jgi:hypothetical protein
MVALELGTSECSVGMVQETQEGLELDGTHEFLIYINIKLLR